MTDPTMKTHRIALIPGDGIGTPVIEAAWEVLERAASLGGFALSATRLPWSCDFYRQTSAMMPADRVDWVTAQAVAARPK